MLWRFTNLSLKLLSKPTAMLDEKKLAKRLAPLVEELRTGKRQSLEINLAGDTQPYRQLTGDFYVVPLYGASIDFCKSADDEVVRVVLRWFTTIERVWGDYADFVGYAIIPILGRIETSRWKRFVRQRLVLCVSGNPSKEPVTINYCLVVPEKYRRLGHLISAISGASRFKYYRGWAAFDVTTSDRAKQTASSYARHSGFITLHSAVKASVPLGSLVSQLALPLTSGLEKSILSFIYQLLRRKDLYTEL
jgi:hypothetical protein